MGNDGERFDEEKAPLTVAVDALAGLVDELSEGKVEKEEFVGKVRGILNNGRGLRDRAMSAEYYTHRGDEAMEEVEMLEGLSSVIDVVCCALDVVRHDELLGPVDGVEIHPVCRTVPRKDRELTAPLLESAVKTLIWAQKAAFPEIIKDREEGSGSGK